MMKVISAQPSGWDAERQTLILNRPSPDDVGARAQIGVSDRG
jgi:hypothetical protein